MRLRNFKNIAFGFLSFAMLCGGCVDAVEDIIDAPSESLTLRFYSAGAGTRADMESSDASLNENLISNLAVAFYPSASGENENAVKFSLLENLGATGEVERKIIISDEEVTRLFGGTETSGATCRVYALANLSDEEIAALGKTPTVAAMKELRVSSEFDTRQVQESFVMSGDATVTYSVNASGNKTAAGNVQLVRSAAKITLNIKLPESYEDLAGNIWQPVASYGTGGSMRVLLNNGVKNSSVLVPEEGYEFKDEDYFNITTADATYGFVDNKVNNSEYPNKQRVPFYTYPNRWENTPGERHRTALTLIVPWHNITTNTYQTFYYRVPVTSVDMPGLVSNHSYQIDLNVGMLGSAMPETAVEITGNYRVVDWARETIDVNIKDYRYLVVSPRNYVVDNVNNITIPFHSSHDVEVLDISMTYERFNSVFNASGYSTGAVVSIEIPKSVIDRSYVANGGDTQKLCDYSVAYNQTSKQYALSVDHPLKIWKPVKEDGSDVSMTGSSVENVIATINRDAFKYQPATPEENAYSPYEIKITLAHKDNHEYTSTVTILQYPMMYIARQENPGDNDGNRFINNGNNSHLGYTVTPSFGGSSGHANPNMYIINVTSLGIDSQYVIGDPRALFTNNQLDNEDSSGRLINRTQDDPDDAEEYKSSWWGSSSGWCSKANALYDGSQERTLRFYYPTEETNLTENMVSPKFRMASSWGTVSGSINAVNARRRCATYQEMGCPAGRWRLPTFGEIKYIVELHEKGFIPSLFTAGASYLSAQGWVYIPKTTDSDQVLKPTQNAKGNGTVRAVYDEWYWEKETNYVLKPGSDGNYTYTLGDMPMRNPQN